MCGRNGKKFFMCVPICFISQVVKNNQISQSGYYSHFKKELYRICSRKEIFAVLFIPMFVPSLCGICAVLIKTLQSRSNKHLQHNSK